MKHVLIAALAVLTFAAAADAEAQTPVSLELVIAVDTSISIDGFEYRLIMGGIAAAFRTPEVIELIGRQDGVAVTLFQWSSRIHADFMIPWRLLEDRSGALAFADQVERAARDPDRVFTGIGGAIEFGVRLIEENRFEGLRRKIDVSGDGQNNTGPSLALARRDAQARGIIINGLPILTRIVDYQDREPIHTSLDYYDLQDYYRDKVIIGPGAFVETAQDYDDFARAFLRKLIRELTPPPLS